MIWGRYDAIQCIIDPNLRLYLNTISQITNTPVKREGAGEKVDLSPLPRDPLAPLYTRLALHDGEKKGCAYVPARICALAKLDPIHVHSRHNTSFYPLNR